MHRREEQVRDGEYVVMVATSTACSLVSSLTMKWFDWLGLNPLLQTLIVFVAVFFLAAIALRLATPVDLFSTIKNHPVKSAAAGLLPLATTSMFVIMLSSGGLSPYGPGNAISKTVEEVPIVSYRAHVQKDGWLDDKTNGETAGTIGESKRLEAIKINLKEYPGFIQYRSHIQGIGWEEDWQTDDGVSGTTGQAKRLEAIQITLTGDLEKEFDIYYRVHVQKYGWLDWAKNGAAAGSVGLGLRAEAIEIVITPKGDSPPGATTNPLKERQ